MARSASTTAAGSAALWCVRRSRAVALLPLRLAAADWTALSQCKQRAAVFAMGLRQRGDAAARALRQAPEAREKTRTFALRYASSALSTPLRGMAATEPAVRAGLGALPGRVRQQRVLQLLLSGRQASAPLHALPAHLLLHLRLPPDRLAPPQARGVRRWQRRAFRAQLYAAAGPAALAAADAARRMLDCMDVLSTS